MSVFRLNLIECNVEANSKEEVLNHMINVFDKNGLLNDKEEFKKAIFEREEMMSTGVGFGLAIPHGRSNSANELAVAVCSLKKAIDYGAIDDEPVETIFMIAIPEEFSTKYMRILASVSKFYSDKNNKNKILFAKNEKELYESVMEIENEI